MFRKILTWPIQAESNENLERFFSDYFEYIAWGAVAFLGLSLFWFQSIAVVSLCCLIAVSTVIVWYNWYWHKKWLVKLAPVAVLIILTASASSWALNGLTAICVLALMTFPGSLWDDVLHGRWARVFQ